MSHVIILVLSVIVVVIALLLIGLILIQQSKGGGFGGSFGGVGQDIFGAQAGNHLTKLTIWFTASFFVLTLVLAAVTGRRGAPESAAEIEQDLEDPPKAVEKSDSGVSKMPKTPGTVTKKVPGGTITMTPVNPPPKSSKPKVPGTVTKKVPGGTITMTPVENPPPAPTKPKVPGTVTKKVPGGTITMTPVKDKNKKNPDTTTKKPADKTETE